MKTSVVLLLALGLSVAAWGQEAEPKTAQGIQVTFESGGKKDVTVRPNVLLYTSEGTSPSPFLKSGPFTATYEGFISVDLRDRYTFRAEVNGSVTLQIGEKVILEGTAENGLTEESSRARLSKGLNPFRVVYTSPKEGDGYLRLHWSSPDFSYEPITEGSLLHSTESKPLAEASMLRKGRELFAEHRCAKCHTGGDAGIGMAELAMDAPTFEGIGSRRNAAWMAKWIDNPDGARAIASMPALLYGDTSAKDAADIAAFLGSLKGDAIKKSSGAAEKGKSLFTTLHCEACHNPPGEKVDESRLSLTHVGQKFTDGALAAFLQKPEAHYQWIRMPNFKLKGQEAGQLAAYLLGHSEKPLPAVNGDAGRGRGLVETLGCASCHSGPVENKFKTIALEKIGNTSLEKGCLTDAPTGKAPRYSFSADERAALRGFLRGSRESLKQSSQVEFASRQIEALNCTKCHGQYDGFPHVSVMGGKLRPEWAEDFIAGRVDYKPRPWVHGRMPTFPSRAKGLAQGMSMIHGMPPVSLEQPKVDQALAKDGLKMVGTDGGFSCIACHAVGTFGATQVFESAGINLAYSGERLTKPFFERWLLNPLRIDPQTKMPVYFPGGQSMLYDFYDGDAQKQILAFWEYIRQGKNIPLPAEAQ